MKPQVIFENEDYLIFNKPSGWLTIPDRHHPKKENLLARASAKYKTIFVVHRLDKDTSGLVCLAKNKAAHRHLSISFQNRKVDKKYQAIVHGRPVEMKGIIKQPLGPTGRGKMRVSAKGKSAQTNYRVLESGLQYSLLELQLITGRMHQIRVHLQYLGHPVVADAFYGDGRPFFLSSIKPNYKTSGSSEEQPLLKRLALHAKFLSFEDARGDILEAKTPLPKDMQVMLKQLRRWG